MALVVAFPPGHTFGQSRELTEYQVKATYLYNFSRFVEWPDSAFDKNEHSFVIGVLGDDPFGELLDAIVKEESVGGRKLVVRRFGSVEEASTCQLLFLSDSTERRLPEILKDLTGKSILTVSDINNFAKRGGMIRFTLEGNRVRFEINLRAAEQARLTVSSQLLKLAKLVTSNPRGSN